MISRRKGLSGPAASKVVELVSQALVKDGLELPETPAATEQQLKALGAPSSESCQADSACLAKLGRMLQAKFVVGVDVGRVAGELALGVDAVSTKTGERIAQSVSLLSGEPRVDDIEVKLQPFAASLKDALQPPVPVATQPPVAAGAPIAQASLTPKTLPVLTQTEPQAPSKVPLYVVGGGAAVAGVVAIVATLKGMHDKSTLNDPAYAGSHSYQEAQHLSSSAGAELTVGAASAAVTAGLVGTAVYLWTKSK